MTESVVPDVAPWGGSRRPRHVALVILCALLLGPRTGIAADLPKFVLPPGDLPRIAVEGRDVTFMPNGAFVLAKDGIYLMDGGLSFSDTDWKRFGTQIRRSIDSDTYKLDEAGTKLTFRGTLQDLERNDFFKFTEVVESIPGGLRFSYEAQPVSAMMLAHFGCAFHLPKAQWTNEAAGFLPGFSQIVVKENPKASYLASGSSRRFFAAPSSQKELHLYLEGLRQWFLFDDAKYNLPIYRVWLWLSIPTNPVQPETKFAFSFRLNFKPFQPSPVISVAGLKGTLTEDGTLTLWQGPRALLHACGYARALGSKANLYQAERGAPQTAELAGLPAEKWDFTGTFGEGALAKLIAYSERVTAQDGKLLLDFAIAPPKGVQLEEAGAVFAVRADAFKPETVQARGGEPAAEAKEKPAIEWDKLNAAEALVFGAGGELTIELKSAEGLGWLPKQAPFWGASCYQVHTPVALPEHKPDVITPVRFRVELTAAAQPKAETKKP